MTDSTITGENPRRWHNCTPHPILITSANVASKGPVMSLVADITTPPVASLATTPRPAKSSKQAASTLI
ncbi:hypothetical protein V2J09_004088 [Rumex salicifolius]